MSAERWQSDPWDATKGAEQVHACLPRFRVCWSRISLLVAASNFEVEPLFVVPRLVSGFQANGRKNDIPHKKPVVLGPWQNDKSAIHRPNAAARPTVA